jgi:hypothetical protein
MSIQGPFHPELTPLTTGAPAINEELGYDAVKNVIASGPSLGLQVMVPKASIRHRPKGVCLLPLLLLLLAPTMADIFCTGVVWHNNRPPPAALVAPLE